VGRSRPRDLGHPHNSISGAPERDCQRWMVDSEIACPPTVHRVNDVKSAAANAGSASSIAYIVGTPSNIVADHSPMSRNAALGGAIVGLVADIDNVAKAAYWELSADHHPAFARHRIPELGFERSRREPQWSTSCRVAGRHSEIDLPSLHIGGWYDIFCQGTLDNFTAMQSAGRPATLIMGPWAQADNSGYLGDVNFGLASSAELLGFRRTFTDVQLGWFRQHLVADSAAAQTDSAQPTLPPVLLFVMGTNEWREEQEWPLSRAVPTELFLRADGQLTVEPPTDGEGTDTYRYDPTDPVITTGGALLMSNEFRPGPLDQAPIESRPDVLVYTTEPMPEDVEGTGRVRAVLHAATDAPSTDWVVRLCDVDPAGTSRNIVDGIVRSVAPRINSPLKRSTYGPPATSFAQDTASGYTSHRATSRAGRAISTPASPSKTEPNSEPPNNRSPTMRRGHRTLRCP
jgi:X-Pro dipeptidyl-peptidase C-terminal non-catalytic domain/X-Pro dipeptidyl-peptidase (S15 family)